MSSSKPRKSMNGHATAHRGQAAVEFLMFVSFFLLMFIILSALFYRQQADELASTQSLVAREIGQQYADTANFALRAGNSFRGSFSYPTDVLGTPYNLTFSNGSSGYVYINWVSESGAFESFSAPLSTRAIQLDAGHCIGCYGAQGGEPGVSIITVPVTGNVTYENRDGILFISNQ